jgi:hypothetical protein
MKNIVWAAATLCVAMLLVDSAARAESWYIGGGAGVADINGLCQGAPSQYCDDQGAALRLFGGWHPNEYFALEGAVDVGVDFLTPGARAAGYDGHTSASFIGINAIGFIPLGSRVSLFGGVSGAFGYASTRVSDYYSRQSGDCRRDWYDNDWYYYCTNHGNSNNDYTSHSTVAGGALVGVQVNLNRRVQLRAQAQRYFNVDGGLAFEQRRDVDFFTVNGLFSFL